MRITREAEYIIDCAKRSDARLVSLGQLIFFSTRGGDAWVLDPEDKLALCLARQGETQQYRIMETETTFAIEWAATYIIEEGAFIVLEGPGEPVRFTDYPTAEIIAAERRITREGEPR